MDAPKVFKTFFVIPKCFPSVKRRYALILFPPLEIAYFIAL